MSEVCEKQHATMRNAKLLMVNSMQILRPGVAMYAGVLDAGVGLGRSRQSFECCLAGSREAGGLRMCTSRGASYSTITTLF